MLPLSFKYAWLFDWHRFRLVGLLSFLLLCMIGCRVPESVDPETAVDAALAKLAIYDFRGALEQLDALPAPPAPDDFLWPAATYARAIANWHFTPKTPARLELAEEGLRALVESAAETSFGRRAHVDLARLLELPDYSGEPVDPGAARALYDATIRSYPGTETADAAALHRAALAVHGEDGDAARAAHAQLLDYAQTEATDEMAALIYQTLGLWARMQFQDSELAFRCLALAQDHGGFLPPTRADHYLWLLGEYAILYDEPERAVLAWRDIVVDNPRSIFGWEARQRLLELAESRPDLNIGPVPALTAPTKKGPTP